MSSDLLIYNTTALSNAFATNATCASAAAIQSGVYDFGTARAANWLCRLTAQMSSAPAASKTVDVYIGWSTSSTAGFPGGAGTAAGAFTGLGTASQGTPQLEFVGAMPLQLVTTLQTMDVGVVFPKLQYGVVVLYNSADVSIGSSTAPTTTFTPIKDQST